MHLGRKAKVPEVEMYSFKQEQLAKKMIFQRMIRL